MQNYLLYSLSGAITCRCLALPGLPLPFYSDESAHANRKKQNAHAKDLFSFIFPVWKLHCEVNGGPIKLRLPGQSLLLGPLFFFLFLRLVKSKYVIIVFFRCGQKISSRKSSQTEVERQAHRNHLRTHLGCRMSGTERLREMRSLT